MFEYSGILCRHILTVFTMTNVLTLPSHYILKRWTKNAKSSAGSDELHGQEFLTSRYSNLCREAIRYAEEGAVTVETYNVAVTGLKEGGKKVTAMKRNVAKAKPPNSQASGTNNNKKTTTSSTSDLTPLLWPRQDEITGRFNLNDSGGPVQSGADPNLPRMTPVSLHRDGGPSGNAVLGKRSIFHLFLLFNGIGLHGINLIYVFCHIGASSMPKSNDMGNGEQKLKSREESSCYQSEGMPILSSTKEKQILIFFI
jgi:hypothetical protein